MRFLRWLGNWKNGATVVASVAVALVAFVVIDASQARQDALDARNNTAKAATRRIDKLNDRIEELGADLVAQSEANGAEIGRLSQQVADLQEQVRQMGGDPVVIVQPTSQPQRTTTTAPPSTTTTTQPAPEEEPPDGGTCLLFICVGA